MFKRIYKWLDSHRWLLCLNPKGWSEQDERQYKITMGDWRGYGR